MKRINFFFAVVVLLSFNIAFGQDINPQITKFLEHYKVDNVSGMETVSQEMLELAPDNYAGYAFMGYTFITKNDLVSAEKFMKQARNINPVDQASYGISSYLAFLSGNIAEAEKLMNYSFQVRFDDSLLEATLDDINQIERLTGKDLSALKAITQTANEVTSDSPAMMQKYYNCQRLWYEGKECSDITSVSSYFDNLSPQNPVVMRITDYYKALSFYNSQKWDEAKVLFAKFLKNPATASNDLGYAIAQSYYYLSYYDEFNGNSVYLNATKGLEALKKVSRTTFLKCQLLQRKSVGLEKLGKKDEQLQVAKVLLSEAKKLNFQFMEAQASNTIGSYYLVSAIRTDREKAFSYLDKAYNLALQLNDEGLANIIAGNYAISLWQAGKKDQAVAVATKSYETYLANKDYPGAQVIANNLGFMSYATNDFKNAVTMFSKAVAITETYRKDLSAAQQLAVMNEHSGAYGGLIMSCQKRNDVNTLFEAQDLNRSRLLRDKLNTNAKAQTIEATQKMLQPDEVLLYFSNASPGEMVVSVLTNTSASIGHNYPIDSWLRIKKKFINRINKKPNNINSYVTKLNEEIIDGQLISYNDKAQGFNAKDFEQFVSLTRELLNNDDANLKTLQTDFLKQWYSFLVAPIASKIQGKKTLIISGEGSLNFLPFEAFVTPSGKYLIEDYNIKYIPSASVWASLQDRSYQDNRKPLLAMGGATYKDPNNKSGDVRNMQSLYEIQDEITKKINTNKTNLSSELKALGFGGANYLAGTLKEVENLKKIIPEAKVLSGNDMKESDIKKMNTSGDLASYKWVHIATHGFALDHIPELSGVMMTQPTNGDGNEDTFLLTHEIANLNLKADMAVLSACETALGKVYGGEGVNGLNSALLTAGANNTMLSLWPVSDAGTMIFMTLVYDNLYTKKQPADEAVNNAKRSLLAGEYGAQFASPIIWAPFVLSGK